MFHSIFLNLSRSGDNVIGNGGQVSRTEKLKKCFLTVFVSGYSSRESAVVIKG